MPDPNVEPTFLRCNSPRSLTVPTLITFEQLREALPNPRGIALRLGPGRTEMARLHLPNTDPPFPVAVVIHGGCWGTIAGPAYMEPVAAELAGLGWAAYTISFPRLGEGGESGVGGREVLAGVRAAVRRLETVATIHRLDLDRTVSIGHSSGGHLALWLAGRDQAGGGGPDGSGAAGGGLREVAAPREVRLSGAIALAGIADLQAFDGMGERGCGDAVRRLLGPDPGPTPLLEFCPAARLPVGIPQLLLSGERDRTVPPVLGEGYLRRALAAGDRADHRIVEGAGHFELVAPWTDPWRRVRSAVSEFLTGISRPPPSSPGSP